MAKPIHGDPKKDKSMRALAKSIDKAAKYNNLKNADAPTLKILKRSVGRFEAEIEFAQSTNLDQKLGGIKGAAKAKAKKKSVKK